MTDSTCYLERIDRHECEVLCSFHMAGAASCRLSDDSVGAWKHDMRAGDLRRHCALGTPAPLTREEAELLPRLSVTYDSAA